MAETATIAKWIVRNVCLNHELMVSFSPKVSLEHAGSGMHIHIGAVKQSESVLSDSNGGLSDFALEMMGGLLKYAPSLAAFGNAVPVSYLRFISAQESPMSICWGARNRLALIRIPLWWDYKRHANSTGIRRTFEYRAPDALANPYLILGALAIAVNEGLQNPKEALQIAHDSHADAADTQRQFKPLPCSCRESAHNLKKDRQFYEKDDVFPKRLVDKTIEKLMSYRDGETWKRLQEKSHDLDSLLKQYLNCG
jgi:glutamine synthetase